jgi:hypothetical protein
MARALNVLPTSYSYGDSMIMARAVEAGKVKRVAMHNYEFPNNCSDPFLLEHLPSL